MSPSHSRTETWTPVSSRTSRAAVSSAVSPKRAPPFGRPVTGLPAGVMMIVSEPRTTTPPKDVSRSSGRRPRRSVDIAVERVRVVDGEPASPLRDHAGALEHREEAAGRLARGARELRHVGLRRGDEDVVFAGALGARLLDELAEHCGDAALDRLEGLTGQALVGGAQPPAERDHQLDRDIGVAGHERAHVGPKDRERVEVVGRLHRCRAALGVEHRQLAEDVARAERRQRDLATVRVLAQRAGVAAADDVAGVGVVALAEHDLTCLEAAGDGDRGDLFEVPAAELLEDRDASQQRSGVLGAGGHEDGGYHSARRGNRAPGDQSASSAASRRRRTARRLASQASTSTSESGSSAAPLTTITPAATSRIRPASPSASPGVHAPSSSGAALRSATISTPTLAKRARFSTRESERLWTAI